MLQVIWGRFDKARDELVIDRYNCIIPSTVLVPFAL
jgi:hypothetical protein